MPHIYHENYYHIIWSTKNRLEIISVSLGEKIRELITIKISKINGKCLEFNTVSDHCHLLSTYLLTQPHFPSPIFPHPSPLPLRRLAGEGEYGIIFF